MKRVTIKDVAREAGVSVSAVSRTFTDGASASKSTRASVRAAAERLGYRPSNIARGLVRQRTNLITLVTGRMADPFDTLFLEELCERVSASGRRLLLVPAHSPSGGEEALLRAIDDQADAVIVSAGTMSLEASEKCVRAGLPVILAGRVFEADGIDCVVAENRDGGRQAAALFTRTGRVAPAFFGQPQETFSDRERREGFVAKAENARVLRADAADDDALVDYAIAELSGAARPDAVFCSTDRLALAVIEAASALGLSVPGDVAVIGFNNIPAAARRSFRLTTIDYRHERAVSEIMSLLERRLADPAAASEVRRIPVQLVVRDTTPSGRA